MAQTTRASNVLQCAAVRRSVMQRVAVCCSVSQCVAVELQWRGRVWRYNTCVQYVTECCRVLCCAANVLQCVVV